MLEDQRATQQALDKLAAVTTMKNLRRNAQEALDDLWAEHKIPFQLTAHKVEVGENPDYYTVRFHDSRLPLLFIYWNPKESFKTAVREVVKCTVGKRRTD